MSKSTQYTAMTIGMVNQIKLSHMMYDDGTFGHFIKITDDNGNIYSFTLHTDKRQTAEILFESLRTEALQQNNLENE